MNSYTDQILGPASNHGDAGGFCGQLAEYDWEHKKKKNGKKKGKKKLKKLEKRIQTLEWECNQLAQYAAWTMYQNQSQSVVASKGPSSWQGAVTKALPKTLPKAFDLVTTVIDKLPSKK